MNKRKRSEKILHITLLLFKTVLNTNWEMLVELCGHVIQITFLIKVNDCKQYTIEEFKNKKFSKKIVFSYSI